MNTKTNTNKSKRTQRGFKLVFPTGNFTISSLNRQKRGEVEYITLYKRVRTALAKGIIVPTGELKAPFKSRKGRYEKVYTLAKKVVKLVETAASSAPVAGVTVDGSGNPLVN